MNINNEIQKKKKNNNLTSKNIFQQQIEKIETISPFNFFSLLGGVLLLVSLSLFALIQGANNNFELKKDEKNENKYSSIIPKSFNNKDFYKKFKQRIEEKEKNSLFSILKKLKKQEEEKPEKESFPNLIELCDFLQKDYFELYITQQEGNYEANILLLYDKNIISFKNIEILKDMFSQFLDNFSESEKKYNIEKITFSENSKIFKLFYFDINKNNYYFSFKFKRQNKKFEKNISFEEIEKQIIKNEVFLQLIQENNNSGLPLIFDYFFKQHNKKIKKQEEEQIVFAKEGFFDYILENDNNNIYLQKMIKAGINQMEDYNNYFNNYLENSLLFEKIKKNKIIIDQQQKRDNKKFFPFFYHCKRKIRRFFNYKNTTTLYKGLEKKELDIFESFSLHFEHMYNYFQKKIKNNILNEQNINIYLTFDNKTNYLKNISFELKI